MLSYFKTCQRKKKKITSSLLWKNQDSFRASRKLRQKSIGKGIFIYNVIWNSEVKFNKSPELPEELLSGWIWKAKQEKEMERGVIHPSFKEGTSLQQLPKWPDLITGDMHEYCMISQVFFLFPQASWVLSTAQWRFWVALATLGTVLWGITLPFTFEVNTK